MESHESPAELSTATSTESKTSIFHPRNLFDLFFRPYRFFERIHTYEHKPYIYICAWLYALIRVFPYFFSGSETRLGLVLLNLLFFLLTSAIGGIIAWGVFGWWYQTRIFFAGDILADGFVVRLVYFYSGIVSVLPTLLLILLFVGLYPERNAPFLIAFIPVVAVSIWGLFVSYIGVRTCFQTPMEKTAFWFIILPILSEAIVNLVPRIFSR